MGEPDIAYKDESGKLTSALIERVHLDKSHLNEKLEYHIEVKTTTKESADEKFYLSKAQFEVVWLSSTSIRAS